MTILFPGLVTVLIPFGFVLEKSQLSMEEWLLPHFAATFLILLGVTILGRCIWEFANWGKGTLAPFDAPTQLVVQGIYKYVRNPMYLGVYLILIGEAWFFQSLALVTWLGVFFLLSSLVVILYEERQLQEQFGEMYTEYRNQVRRWIPGKPYKQS